MKDTSYSEKGNCALASEQKKPSSMRPVCCELREAKYDKLEILKSYAIVLYITVNREEKWLQETH